MKKLLLVTLLTGLSFQWCFAQGVTNATPPPNFDIFPKSPEAAAISKYGAIPVNLNTGVPNISIPIYTMQLRGLSVPIALSYNSSGIKVNEQATNVGLGWSLSSGGAVTASVSGIPDFEATGWVFSASKTPQTGTYQTDWSSIDPNITVTPHFLTDSTYLFYKDILEERSDSQPDVFFASFLGKSIKFYYDQSGNAHLMPYRRVKVETLSPGFRITDENDVVYTFGTEERNVTTSDAPTAFNDHGMVHISNNSTFYLTSAVTPYGDSVRFNYGGRNVTFKNPYSESRSEIRNDCGVAQPSDRQVHSTTTSVGVRIESIVSSKGDSVVFTYNTAERLDLPNGQSLAGVSVYKKNNPSFGKSFAFSYSYFGIIRPSSVPDYQESCRLRLDTVKETGQPPYVFTYESQAPPFRLSLAEDHWGYYNRQDDNSTLMPVDSAWSFPTGGNREPDSLGTRAGILTSIKYPTGGKTVFNYELNTAYLGKSFDVPVPLQAYANASTTVVNTQNFTIPSGTRDMSIQYVTPSQPIEGLEPIHQFATIQIKQGGTLVRQLSGSDLTGEPISLSPGSYTFRLCIDTNNIGVYVKLFYRLSTDPDTIVRFKNYPAGGLRIKSTDDYATDGTIALNTSYDYSQDSDSTRSSNMIDPTPMYRFTTHAYGYYPIDDDFLNCDYRSQGSSNWYLYDTGNGTTSYYENVKVYKRSKSGSGYTSYRYLPPAGDGALGWPYPPHIRYDWLSDLVAEQREYKYDPGTNSYHLLTKTANSYQFNTYAPNPSLNPPHESYVRGIKIGVVTPVVSGTPSPGESTRWQPPVYFIATYDLRTSWFYQTAKEEREYDPLDTNKKIITTTKYFYDNPDHIELTRQEVNRSTGEHYNLMLRYPKDYNSSYAFNSSPLVEKRGMINNGTADRLTNAEITTYKNQAGSFPNAYYSLKSTGSISPSSVPLYDGTTVNSAYEHRIDYAYDPNNNLATITKASVSPTGYQWGYNAEYPIAECKGALSKDFYYEGFEQGNGNGTVDNCKTGHHSYTGTYSKSLTGLTSGSYLLTYWLKGLSSWVLVSSPVTVSGSTYKISLSGQIDDIRFYPADAQMTTYTYDPAVGITSITDAKGKTIYYEYDIFQRLTNVKDQDGNILKHTDYHYQNQ